MDRNAKFLFNNKKESVFQSLTETVLNEDARLVLNGDIFDFTGMTPCRNGVKEFFNETVPEALQVPELINENCKFRTTRELLVDIQKVFPNFFRCLKNLAAENKLVYIPGNHDCDFINPPGQNDLANRLGLSFDKIEWARRYMIGENLIVTHGNEYDSPNRTTRSCVNPGTIFTSALYKAALPALQMKGVHPDIIEAIPAVRPEENVIEDLCHFLPEHELQNFLLAFTRLLARNHYFTGIRAVPGWFLTHEVPVISKLLRSKVTTTRVKNLLPKDEWLLKSARQGARELYHLLLKENKIKAETIIVLGHTHELDRADNYINLGTWLDHLRGLDPEEIAEPEISLPVLKSTGLRAGDLIEFKNLQYNSNFSDGPDIPLEL